MIQPEAEGVKGSELCYGPVCARARAVRGWGAAQRVCSGVGSEDKDLIHRTAHYPAGRGWTQRLAGCRLPELCARPNIGTTKQCKLTLVHTLLPSFLLKYRAPFSSKGSMISSK